jgi:hypothetical protein
MTGWWFQRLPIVPPQKSRTQLVLRLVVSSCLLHFYKAASQRLSLRWVPCQAEMLWWMQRTACVESNPVTLGWLKRQEYTPKKEKPKIILKKYNSTIKLYLFLCPIFFGVAIGWITMDNPRTSTRFDEFRRMSWINGGFPVTMGFYTKMVQRLGWWCHMVPAFWETSCVLWNFLHVALCWDPKCLRTTSLPKFQEQFWWNVHGPRMMGPWFPEVCHTTQITNPNSMGRGVHRGTINGPYILYKFQDTVVVLRSADPVCAEEAQSAFVKGWISELDQPSSSCPALGQIGRRCWHQFGHLRAWSQLLADCLFLKLYKSRSRS